MKAEPLSVETRGGALFITVDTPGCAVNIFSPALAVQLLHILESLDAAVRAVVIRSAKPDSFINGAALMLASAVARPEDVPRLTSTIRRAYQAFGDLAIPTLAAIRGNCYGCAIEFILNARYRIAADGYDTHFYMTEIADYLCIPTFGGTQRLPRLLGIEDATDFLLWGARWSAPEAAARGLVDLCVPDAEFDAHVERVAMDLARDGASPRLAPPRKRPLPDLAAHRERTRARILGLPPMYRDVYMACHELMERTVRTDASVDADYEAEMLASGRSLMTTISKSAITHFFVRQTCELICERDSPETSSFVIRCDADDSGPSFMHGELERRRIRGVAFEAEPPTSHDALHFVGYSDAPAGRGAAGKPLAMTHVLASGPIIWNTDVVLYAPSWPHGIPFVEIACARPSESAHDAYRLLRKAGVRSILTQPTSTFAINDLLRAYLLPQVAFISAGESKADLAATLLEFGFTRLAGDWLAGWDQDALVTLLVGDRAAPELRHACREALRALPRASEAGAGSPRDAIDGAIVASLLDVARRDLRAGVTRHPSMMDVAAREILDFPLGHATLCRYVTVARARELSREASRFAAWVPPTVIESLREYAENGQDFYR